MPTHRRVSKKITAMEKPYWRVSDAREVLDLWRRSGASLSEFAREHELCRNRLDRWRDRLDAEPTTPRFHRVRLVGAVDSRPATEARTGGIEIVVSGGRRVTVRSGFDPDLLAEVVRVLEALAC